MRLAMISSYPPKRCGIAEFSDELVSALKAAGNDVLRVGDSDSSGADLATDLGARKGLEVARNAIERDRCQIVHLQWEPGLFSRAARLRIPKWLNGLGIPVLVTFHSIATLLEDSARGRASLALSNRAERQLVKVASAGLTTTTKRMGDLLQRKYSVPAPAVTPLGIGARRTASSAAPSSHTYISFGFIGAGKRLETVVEVARASQERRFIIAGAPAGPRGDEYARDLQARGRGLENLSLQVGWMDEAQLDGLIASASATLLATPGAYRASASLTRSVSLGVPVIAVRGSSIGEPVETTGAGELAEDDSPGAIIDALGRFECNYAQALEGVARAQGELSWDSVARKLTAIYGRAAG